MDPPPWLFGNAGGDPSTEGALVWEYWWRWQNDQYGWPPDGQTSPHLDRLRSYRATLAPRN